ncbi:MAG: RNA polymerase sigma factor [Thermoguttaceae bacterium]
MLKGNSPEPDPHPGPTGNPADCDPLGAMLEQPDPEKIRADAALVERCRTGEVAAWAELYAQCHDPLLASIRIMLGPHNGDLDLVDELAARVWYALVANDGALLDKYNPKRGARVITFMRAVAKGEISRYFRAERRRRRRERAALRGKPQHHTAEASESEVSLSEFLGSLPPVERGFADSYLLAPAAADGGAAVAPKHSLASIWQLTARIRRKLLRFLKGPADDR